MKFKSNCCHFFLLSLHFFSFLSHHLFSLLPSFHLFSNFFISVTSRPSLTTNSTVFGRRRKRCSPIKCAWRRRWKPPPSLSISAKPASSIAKGEEESTSTTTTSKKSWWRRLVWSRSVAIWCVLSTERARLTFFVYFMLGLHVLIFFKFFSLLALKQKCKTRVNGRNFQVPCGPLNKVVYSRFTRFFL